MYVKSKSSTVRGFLPILRDGTLRKSSSSKHELISWRCLLLHSALIKLIEGAVA